MAMNPIPRAGRTVIYAALVHCLLAFFVAPAGWERLYEWDSPHWLRAVWAAVFDLPLVIVLGRFIEFRAPFLAFLLIPLNSFLLAWLVITPVRKFLQFRRTGRRHDLIQVFAFFGPSAILLGVVGALWIPSNIQSQKEVVAHNLQAIQAATEQVEGTNRTAQTP
jgi:hypothetical protein